MLLNGILQLLNNDSLAILHSLLIKKLGNELHILCNNNKHSYDNKNNITTTHRKSLR